MNKLGESEGLSWTNDGPNDVTTNLPPTIGEEIAVGTLIAIIIGAAVSIILLFMMAIFIDCRHQKKRKIIHVRRAKILKLPHIRGRINESIEDRCTIANKMVAEESEPPSTSVIVA